MSDRDCPSEYEEGERVWATHALDSTLETGILPGRGYVRSAAVVESVWFDEGEDRPGSGHWCYDVAVLAFGGVVWMTCQNEDDLLPRTIHIPMLDG